MSELLDPFNFDKNLNEEKKQRIQEVKSSSSKQEERVKDRANRERNRLLEEIREKERLDAGSYVSKGCVAGAIIGLFPCIPTSNHGDFFGAFLIWGAIIAFFGIIMAIVAKGVKDTKHLKASIESVNDSEASQIKKINKDLSDAIAKIEAELEQKKTLHEAEFNKAQRESSLKFVGSPITQEITEFIVKRYKQTIESSDRRPHVMRVKVPLTFEVYRNKVETPYGTYDFTLQRVKHLRDINEAAALANAVATAVHTDIVSSFPIDPSGGEVTPMDIDYEYRNNCVQAKMTYLAWNANYEQARSF